MDTPEHKQQQQQQDRQKAKKLTIESLFHYELTFIKLCAGFLFESDRYYFNVFYRTLIIVGSRFLAAKYYYTYPLEFETFSKAATQNMRLFWTFYLTIAHTSVFVTLLTGIKYHNLILVILKKRFDTSYLQPDYGCRANEALAERSNGSLASSLNAGSLDGPPPSSPSPTAHSTLATLADQSPPPPPIAGCDIGRIDPVPGSPGILRTHQNPRAMEQQSDTNSPPSTRTLPPSPSSTSAPSFSTFASTSRLASALNRADRLRNNLDKPMKRVSRVKTARYFLIANLILTTLSSYLRNHAYSSPGRHQSRIPQRQPSYRNFDHLNRTIGLSLLFPRSLSQALFPTGGFSGIDARANHEFRLSTVQQTKWANNLLVQHSLNMMRTLLKLLFEFIQASLNTHQTYGHLFVVLMVTATITDMINYSRHYDGLISDQEMDKLDECEPSIRRVSASKAKHCRRPLLTTELLIQARDVLILLRCTMSLDYLMLLIVDLARLMSAFCMFSAAISMSKLQISLMLTVDYISIAFNMSLTRLGYHWLHGEVHKLKKIVEENNLLNATTTTSTSDGDKLGNNKRNARDKPMDANRIAISQSERITTYRLADHIDTLWPTDWFTPDLKSYLKQNIFVITFVATLQQLVEAGSKFDFQTSNKEVP